MYFHLTFSLTLSHRELNDCKGALGEQQLELSFCFGITSTDKRAWWECEEHPTELTFFYLGHQSVQQSQVCQVTHICYQKHI